MEKKKILMNALVKIIAAIIAAVIGAIITHHLTIQVARRDTVEFLSLHFDTVSASMQYEQALSTIFEENVSLHARIAALEGELEQIERVPTPENNGHTSGNPPAPTSPSTPTPQQDLSIQIDSFEIFTDGFYFEAPENVSVDFDKGIFGKFHYSRPLTQEELDDWGHGGTLFDANMNQVEWDDYLMFWSDPNGYFAMQFPRHMPTGRYIYRIHQEINETFIYVDIDFYFSG